MTKSKTFSVAPMMDWTDRHCRYFHRLLSPSAILYTEMVTTGALVFGDVEKHLLYNKAEHPVILQLGGNDPQYLAQSAKLGEDYGYDGINLNVGCPSDRVQNGRFGACLMGEPETVAAGVAAMMAAVDIPVTVKTRIGIDEQDSEEFLHRFVKTVAEAGCETFIIHARKAWLSGLSPKENRTIPPLKYDVVYRLKQAFPHLYIGLNGGLTTLEQCVEAFQYVDEVMIGRAAYQNPWFLTELETAFGNGKVAQSRESIIQEMQNYCAQNLTAEWPAARHMLGLYKGQSGAKAWRRQLSERHQLCLPSALHKS